MGLVEPELGHPICADTRLTGVKHVVVRLALRRSWEEKQRVALYWLPPPPAPSSMRSAHSFNTIASSTLSVSWSPDLLPAPYYAFDANSGLR